MLQAFTGWPFDLGFHHVAKEVIRGQIEDRPVTAFRFEFSRTHLGGTLGLAQDALTGDRGGNGRGIFSGMDPTLGSGGGGGGSGSVNFSERTWTLLSMQMPDTLPGVLIRFQLPWVGSILPGTNRGDLDLGDETFDKNFLVRARVPAGGASIAPHLRTGRCCWTSSPTPPCTTAAPGWSTCTNNPADGFHLWTSGTSLLTLSSAPLGPEGLDNGFRLMATFLDNVPPELWAKAATAPADRPPRPPPLPS